MTVAELRAALADMPDDTPVVVFSDSWLRWVAPNVRLCKKLDRWPTPVVAIT